MADWLQHFHLQRPLWLLALPLLWGLIWALARRVRPEGAWAEVIDRSLLPFLLLGQDAPARRWPAAVAFVAALLAVLACAGPSWREQPVGARQKADALVVLQDLTLSMYAEDVAPSRLKRALDKVDAVLQQRREGVTALVVYSGDAHVVSPLTEDVETIRAMLPALSPGIMPRIGSRPERAAEVALALLRQAGVEHAQLLLITDGMSPVEREALVRVLRGRPVRLSILAVGTPEGAPIPLRDGEFLHDGSGRVVTPGLDRAELQALARELGARYGEARLDDEDIRTLLAPRVHIPGGDEYRALEESLRHYADEGYWLVLPLLPLALLLFRRGALMLLPLAVLLPSPHAGALDWGSLWANRDQRAYEQFRAEDYRGAAANFVDPAWRGASEFRSGQYQEAARSFARGGDARSHYNRGVALAKAGDLAQAEQAFERALQLDPQLEDARYNLDLLRKLHPPPQAAESESPRAGEQGRPDQGASQPGRNAPPSAGDKGGTGLPQGDGQQAQGDQAGSSGSAGSAGPGVGQSRPQAGGGKPSGGAGQQGADGGEASEPSAASEGAGEARPEAGQNGSGEQRAGEAEAVAGGAAAGAQAAESAEDALLQQWLKQVRDNPAELLRRKFESQQQSRDDISTDDGRPVW